jgi:hypothetical protein
MRTVLLNYRTTTTSIKRSTFLLSKLCIQCRTIQDPGNIEHDQNSVFDPTNHHNHIAPASTPGCDATRQYFLNIVSENGNDENTVPINNTGVGVVNVFD